jgi:hypothetical protein
MKRLTLLTLAALSLTVLAQEGPLRTEVVAFPEGVTARAFPDSLGGFERVNYRVSLREGEWLTVDLDTSNLSNCFDVIAPGVSKPVFVGANSGNHHRFRAAVSGDYLIHVHLLRLAARDNQSAVYTLTVQRTDAGGPGT